MSPVRRTPTTTWSSSRAGADDDVPGPEVVVLHYGGERWQLIDQGGRGPRIPNGLEQRVDVFDPLDPEPEWTAAYERSYGRFKLLYPALRPLEDA